MPRPNSAAIIAAAVTTVDPPEVIRITIARKTRNVGSEEGERVVHNEMMGQAEEMSAGS